MTIVKKKKKNVTKRETCLNMSIQVSRGSPTALPLAIIDILDVHDLPTRIWPFVSRTVHALVLANSGTFSV
jgi:hypothetical protein